MAKRELIWSELKPNLNLTQSRTADQEDFFRRANTASRSKLRFPLPEIFDLRSY